MTLRQYLIFIAIGTLAALAAAGIVLAAIDPVTAGGLAFAALYVTMGAALVGLFTLIGTSVRVARHKHEDVGNAVARSLRQGAFFSLLILAALFLSSRGLLSTLTVILLVLLLSFVEFFFLSRNKGQGA